MELFNKTKRKEPPLFSTLFPLKVPVSSDTTQGIPEAKMCVLSADRHDMGTFTDRMLALPIPDQRFMAQNLGGSVQVGEEAPHCGTQTTNFAK